MRRQLRRLLERTFDNVVRDTIPDFRRMENIGQGLLYGKNNGNYWDFLYVVISQMADRFTLEFGRSGAGEFPIEILVFRLKPRELPMRCRVGELAGQKFDIWWEMEDSGATELDGIVSAKVIEAVSMFARLAFVSELSGRTVTYGHVLLPERVPGVRGHKGSKIVF